MAHLKSVELLRPLRPDALGAPRLSHMVCKDAHEQRAVECMPRLDKRREALCARGWGGRRLAGNRRLAETQRRRGL